MSGSEAGRRGRSREELTATAIDCFARHGYRGSTIDRIARMAGVTKGAIYYHFRGKEELLAAAVDERVHEFEDRVQRACEGCSPAEALRRIAAVCVEHACSNDHPRFAIKLMAESIDTNDAVSQQFRDMMRRFRAFLRNLIESGKEAGEFRADADATAMAAGFTSAIVGAEIQYYQDEERFDLAATVHTYMDHILAGPNESGDSDKAPATDGSPDSQGTDDGPPTPRSDRE